jgi:ABC-type transporter MlaC component
LILSKDLLVWVLTIISFGQLPSLAADPITRGDGELRTIIQRFNEVEGNKEYFRANPQDFEDGPVAEFFSLVDLDGVAEKLLGLDSLERLEERDLQRFRLAIRETFRRYLYEWLLSDLEMQLLISPKSLKEISSETLTDAYQLPVKLEIRGLPDLTLYFKARGKGEDFKIHDIGFLFTSYASLKGHRLPNKEPEKQLEKIIRMLKQKNDRFWSEKPLPDRPKTVASL